MYMSQLFTIGDTWFIVRMPLPSNVREAMEDMDMDLRRLRAQEEARLRRDHAQEQHREQNAHGCP